jgi:eukaryotic-like serine/threonine-protein kinase
MTLATGTKLGPYEIVGPLGAGGMGEVYRAKDTRLGRDVAIKILPVEFTADASAKARFEREAKTISGLNHPHICVLYDVGHQDGMDFLVMECVEGETLAKRLEKGPLPLEQVLKFGAQIAEALDKAHRSGIVHRDLKPGNVMLTATGAKLLDFGLAKEVAPLGNLVTLTATPSASPVTEQGKIVGTFQYMSPEQVEGKELDGRSDIFSLGAVLYEMVTGKRAFEGRTQLSVASAILDREPEAIRTVKPVTPPNLERAIQRCLAKDPEERWQAARDLALELNWIAKSGSRTEAAAILPRKTKGPAAWMWWALVGSALALGLLVGAMAWRGSGKTAEPTMVFSAPLPFAAEDMSIAPNGHTVAVVSRQEASKKNVIWLYEVGSEEARALAGTDGAIFPFWSPDGKSLGFFAEGKLKRMDMAGGAVQILCDAAAGRGGTWNKDGVILFTPNGRLTSGIWRVSASGGAPVKLEGKIPRKGQASQRWPMFLPDGKHFIFLSAGIYQREQGDGIYVGALDSDDYKLIVPAGANAAYAEPGYLLYLKDKAILAQKFDTKTFQLSGEPVAVATDLQFLPRILRTTFAARDTELLLVQKQGNLAMSRLTWFDRNGKEVGTVGDEGMFANVNLSADGKAVAVDQTDKANQNTDVWTYDLGRGAGRRLTFESGLDVLPVWSADGKQVVFASSRNNVFDLYVKDVTGAQDDKPVGKGELDKYPNTWSRDGKYLIYAEGADLKYVTFPELKSALFLKAPATLKNAQFSPDGKWVAYASNESGRWEVFVTSFPEARGKWQVSNGGGEQPRWRADGKELFYLAADAKMMAVPVKLGAGFDAGTPVVLFATNPKETLATSEQFIYDVDPSGQRILVNTLVKSGATQPITVVLRWGEK